MMHWSNRAPHGRPRRWRQTMENASRAFCTRARADLIGRTDYAFTATQTMSDPPQPTPTTTTEKEHPGHSKSPRSTHSHTHGYRHARQSSSTSAESSSSTTPPAHSSTDAFLEHAHACMEHLSRTKAATHSLEDDERLWLSVETAQLKASLKSCVGIFEHLHHHWDHPSDTTCPVTGVVRHPKLSLFRVTKTHGISIGDYVDRILTYAKPSNDAVAAAHVLLFRLFMVGDECLYPLLPLILICLFLVLLQKPDIWLDKWSIHRVFACAMLVAVKVTHENPFTNVCTLPARLCLVFTPFFLRRRSSPRWPGSP
jgi:hypothetical protein